MTENILWKSKCLTCYLSCELKERRGIITLGDLKSAPENCPYKISKKISDAIAEQYKAFARSIESSAAFKKLYEISERIAFYNKLVRQQEAIAELWKRLTIPHITFSEIAPITKLLDDAHREIYQRIARVYYPLKDLEIVRQPLPPPPPKSLPAELIDRLSSCKKGRKHWKEFQSICKDIFTYLFVPPLGEPIEESKTETGSERRDLIFQIPYDADGFWQMIVHKYDARALIVSCKNYSEPIGKDEVVDISKYLAKKRLGNFGIILSRYPPSVSALKEIKKQWRDEDKMIICFGDEDLKKMIQLKENNEKPEKLIDRKIFDFLASLE